MPNVLVLPAQCFGGILQPDELVAGCGQAWAELTPLRGGGQPGLALSHTNSSSNAPAERVTENKDQGAKLIYLDFF